MDIIYHILFILGLSLAATYAKSSRFPKALQFVALVVGLSIVFYAPGKDGLHVLIYVVLMSIIGVVFFRRS